jgi:6-phosphogluconolactonase (cycloisomerase 2 family)
MVSLISAASVVDAELPEPEFVLYGAVSGAPPWLDLDPAAGLIMQVRLERDGALLDEIVVAPDGGFSLRIPMDSVDPQRPRTSREGLSLDLFLAGIQLDAANSSQPLRVPATGPRGTYQRLDVDLDGITPGVGFTIVDAQTQENAINGTVDVEILLQNDPGVDSQQVNWLTVGGSATPAAGALCGPNDDFIPASGRADFAPGQTSTTVSVSLCNNEAPENQESFWVRLTNPSGDITLARDEALVTIEDDDGVPSLSVADISLREPRFDSAIAEFRVVLDGVQATSVRFDYATADLTASAGVDYTAISGSATIAAGETQLVLPVNVLADRDSDDGEQFALRLSNPVGAELADAEAIATIADADNDGTVIVDDGGTQTSINGPIDLAVHELGQWLFVANQTGQSVSRFDLASDSGALSNEFSWNSPQLPGAELDGLTALSVADDGQWLILASGGANAISVLSVAPDGDLSAAGIARDGALDGQSVAFEGLVDLRAVAVSPDSAHLYAVSGLLNSLSVLAVEQNGALRMLELEENAIDDPLDTGVLVEGLVNPSDVLVSPDGLSVYAASPDASAILHFSRNADTLSDSFGELAFRASYSATSLSEPTLQGVAQIAMDSNGTYLYAVSPVTGEVVSLAVGINGVLSLVATQATLPADSLLGASDLLLSADQRALLASSATPGSLHLFRRQQDGATSARQVLLANRDASPGLAGASAMAQASARPEVLYLAAFADDRVSVFEVKFKSLLFRDRFEAQ